MSENKELIPQEYFNQLNKLDSELEKSIKNLEAMLKPVQEISKEFTTTAKSGKQLIETINRYNQIQTQVNGTQNQQLNLLREKNNLQQRVVSSTSQEVRSLASLRETLTEINKASDTNAKILEISKKNYEEASNSIDIQRKKLVSLTSELSRTQGLLKRLEDQYKKNIISESEYINRKSILINKEQEQKTTIKSVSDSLNHHRQIVGTTIGSYDNLSAQYSKMKQTINQMSDAETHNGLTKKELEERARILYERMSELQRATGRSTLEVGKYENGLNGASNAMGNAISVFAGNMMTKAVDKIRELASAVKDFIKDSIVLEGRVQGVAREFNRIAKPDLLNDLRKSVNGTLSDFELMKRTLQAKEFSFPLENMGTLMDYASRKATDLDRNVNEVSNTLIRGIGNRSTRILNQYGINMDRVKAEFKKTGDFTGAVMTIMNEQIEQQGNLILTSAEKAAVSTSKWEDASVSVGKRFSWLGDMWNEASGNIADGIKSFADSFKPASEVFDDQIKKVSDLNVNTIPLLKRYDELKDKASLNKVEQKELNEIITTLSSTVPATALEFDKYGNVISVNTQKVYEYIEAEKIRLKWTYKEAIEQTQKSLETQKELYASYQRFITVGGNGIRQFTEKELSNLKDKAQEAGNTIKRLEQELKVYTGVTLEEQQRANEETIKLQKQFNEMTDQELEQWIKKSEEASKEFNQNISSAFDGIVSNWNNTEGFLNKVKGGFLDLIGVTRKYGDATDYVNQKTSEAAKVELLRRQNNKQYDTSSTGANNKKTDNARQKLVEAEAKAIADMSEYEIKTFSEAQKQIITDKKKSYDDRINALNVFIGQQKELISISEANQIDALKRKYVAAFNTEKDFEEKNASQIALIKRKAQGELEKIDREAEKTRLEVIKSYSDQQIKEISKKAEDTANAITKAEATELANLAEHHKEKLISDQEYQQKKTDLAIQAAKDRYDAEMFFLQQQLDTLQLNEDQIEAIEKKIKKAGLDFHKTVESEKTKASDKEARKQEQIAKQLEAKKRELIKETFDFISELLNADSQRELDRLDEQSQANEKAFNEQKDRVERLEASGALSKEQADADKAAIDQNQRKREEELEKQREAIQKKQAEKEKKFAIFQILVNTAMAIMTNIRQLGFLPAIPVNALTAATAAVQIATVSAKKYAKGGKHEKDGPAIVGDGGKHELVLFPDGSTWKTPKTDTLVNLPAGTEIFPDFNKAILSMSMPPPKLLDKPKQGPVIIQENKQQLQLIEGTNQKMDKMIAGINKMRANMAHGNNLSEINTKQHNDK